MSSRGVDPAAAQWGTMALAVIGAAAGGVTHRTAWDPQAGWNVPLLDFWTTSPPTGKLDPADPAETDQPIASLAVPDPHPGPRAGGARASC